MWLRCVPPDRERYRLLVDATFAAGITAADVTATAADNVALAPAVLGAVPVAAVAACCHDGVAAVGASVAAKGRNQCERCS